VTFRTGIAGASGYGGGELVRLVDGHPDLEAVVLTAGSQAGKRLGDVHPHLRGGDRVLQQLDPAAMADLDVVFLALPHGASAEPAMELVARGVKVVDLGSDYRLRDPARYADAYGGEHPHPEQLGAWAYGLPELFRDEIVGADRVAVPGCFPTAVTLAVAPLVAAGMVAPEIVVTAVTGTSGAGRTTSEALTFGAVDEGVRAYKVGEHRHRPEMEQAITESSGVATTVVFTPHLVPMQRGILATCHAGVSGDDVTTAALDDVLTKAYSNAAFVEVIEGLPQTRWVVGSNRCQLTVRVDRTGTAIVLASIDNLIKGAAGQAVQCANLMLGLPEDAGLPLDGWMP
jgi:N-acetyl-gamma-glutamyl-phosphate reductase